MDWELDISRDFGKSWMTVAKKPSPDACKAVARKIHYNGISIDRAAWYRLYSDCGNQLTSVSGANTSWRMLWTSGNRKSRDAQTVS